MSILEAIVQYANEKHKGVFAISKRESSCAVTFGDSDMFTAATPKQAFNAAVIALESEPVVEPEQMSFDGI